MWPCRTSSAPLVEIAAATPASRQLQRETLDRIRALAEQAAADSEHAVPDVAIDGMLGGMAYAIAKAAEEGDPAELPMLRPQLMAQRGALRADHLVHDRLARLR